MITITYVYLMCLIAVCVPQRRWTSVLAMWTSAASPLYLVGTANTMLALCQYSGFSSSTFSTPSYYVVLLLF